jgi:hypothetical protein
MASGTYQSNCHPWIASCRLAPNLKLLIGFKALFSSWRKILEGLLGSGCRLVSFVTALISGVLGRCEFGVSTLPQPKFEDICSVG